jgi:hypothetical protein
LGVPSFGVDGSLKGEDDREGRTVEECKGKGAGEEAIDAGEGIEAVLRLDEAEDRKGCERTGGGLERLYMIGWN